MAWELEEEHFDAFRATFKDDDDKRDRLIDEIFVPCMNRNEVNDDLLALKEREYILSHNDDLVNPLYAVKNLAVFAIRHGMPDNLGFVDNPLTIKDSLTLPEAREYVKQFDRVAVDMYSGSLKNEIAREEAIIDGLYKEGWRYKRDISTNRFSAINRRLYGRSDRLIFTCRYNSNKGREFKSFDEVKQFYERTKAMVREKTWHLPTPEEGEELFRKVNALAEDYCPNAEWGVSMSEDKKTVLLYDEDKYEMEDLLAYVEKELKKPKEKEKDVKITTLSQSAGHITGEGTVDGKPFAYDYNKVLHTMKLEGEGADPTLQDHILSEIETKQEEQRRARQEREKERDKKDKKGKGLVRK